MSGCADLNYIATEMMAPNYSSGPRNPDAPESGVELLVRDNWTLWSGWTDWYHVAYFDTLDECMASIPTYLEANQGGAGILRRFRRCEACRFAGRQAISESHQ